MEKNCHTVIDALQYWSQTKPQHAAFHFIDNTGEISNTLSYQALFTKSLAFSNHILKPTRQGDRVGIILPTGPEFIIAFFGSLLAGAIPVPLSQPTRQQGTKTLCEIINNAEPSVCITHKLLKDTLAEEIERNESTSTKVISFNLDDDCFSQPSSTNPIQQHSSAFYSPDENTIAFLQYTSGSTSAPKGVMVSHKNIYANHKMIREVFGHDDETKQLNWMPLYHDMGLIGHVLHPVCNGHTSYLMDPFVFVQRPRIWLESISRYKITSTGGPNFCYQHCVKRIKPHNITSLDLSSLRVAYNGAEPINPKVIDAFTQLCEPQGFHKNVFLPCYGLAEATLLVSGIRHDQAIDFYQADKDAIQQGQAKQTDVDAVSFPSLGKTASGIALKIIHPHTHSELNETHIGEVCIAGDNITHGYWHNNKATTRSFIAFNNQSFFRTGDLGFTHNDQLYITGRLKDLIIIDGKNYYPQDIEFTTQTVDTLLKENACAAFVVDSENADATHDALIVVQELDRKYKNRADTETLKALKERIRSSISQQHTLAVKDVVLIDCNTMPKTTSGKIKRQYTKYLYENHLLHEVDRMQ